MRREGFKVIWIAFIRSRECFEVRWVTSLRSREGFKVRWVTSIEARGMAHAMKTSMITSRTRLPRYSVLSNKLRLI